MRVITGGGGQACAEGVGLKLEVLGVCAFKELDTYVAQPAGDESANGCRYGANGDCRVADEAVHRVTPDDVGHFVSDDEGKLILVPLAKLQERAGDEDESAGQSEGVWLRAFDDFEVEFTSPVCDAGSEFGADLPDGMGGLRFRVELQLAFYFTCQVSADFVLDANGVGFGARY